MHLRIPWDRVVRVAAVGTLLLGPAIHASGAERRITVVVEAEDAMKGPVLASLRKAFKGRSPLFIHEFDRSRIADPIRKGQLLAALQNSDLVVAVGDLATALALRELEDIPVYFVAGSLLSGGQLASASLTGILSYNVESLLDAARRLWSGRLGLAYTPGYEPIAGAVRDGAKARGFSVVERSIPAARDIPSAIKDLLSQSQALWIVGDPLLARGAGFKYLIERALSGQVPIIAAGAWEVQHGAFLSIDPPAEAVAAEAAAAIRSLADGKLEAARIRTAPSGGMVVYNGTLAEKWKVPLPGGTPWRMLR